MVSNRAKFLEISLRVTGMRRIISRMILHPKRTGRYELPPKSFYKKYTVRSVKIEGRTCVTVKQNTENKRQILYFPGGAYALPPNKAHWSIVERFMQETQADVTLINYPLAPEYTCLHTVDMALKAYEYFCKDPDTEIVLAGDSAGGGLALALAQQLKHKDSFPKPDKLVLFSPWLDVSMDIPVSRDLAESDFLLSKEVLKAAGKQYGGELDLKDPLCSPLYGRFTGVGEIALFTGTKEILYTQAKCLKESFVANSIEISYYEYESMQHVWVLFPIPEAEHALDAAISFINK